MTTPTQVEAYLVSRRRQERMEQLKKRQQYTTAQNARMAAALKKGSND